MGSILKDWVSGLGLRHQGVLLSVVRGCDTAPKEDTSKTLSRAIRGVLLNPHCGDVAKAATFIQAFTDEELGEVFRNFRKNLDHYPHHFVMHVVHAVEIIGYKHPDPATKAVWSEFYRVLCSGLHVNPETAHQLDDRLDADETTFGQRDKL